MINRFTLLKSTAAVSLALVVSPIAYSAQEDSQDENNEGLETITITAQKRIQSIQSVPVSVSAMDDGMLKKVGADTVSDIIPMIPGLSGNTVGLATNMWSIRGISSNDFSVGSEPSVGVFIDDAYIGRNALATGAFFDVERIEVVKGPQGTLFGRNSAAGAISIITKKPTDENTVEIGLGLGNEGQREVNVIANLAATDELSFRFSYYGSTIEGIWEEVTFGEEAEAEQDSFRLSAQWEPSDDFSALLTFNHSDSESNMGGTMNPSLQSIEPGEEYPDRFSRSTQDLETNNTKGVNLRLTWELNDDISLTSITDSRSFDYSLMQDIDGTGEDAIIDAIFEVGTGGATIEFAQPDITQKSISQEFRLNGSANKVDWFVGANYFSEEVDELTQVRMIDTALGLGTLATDETISGGKTTAIGLYGDLTWYMSEQLSFTGGIRWSQDKKDWCNEGSAELYLVAVPTAGEVCGEEEWSETTPRLVANYQATKDIMLYSSVSLGYKGGGFNSVTADNNGDGVGETVAPFDPETVTAYELGIKSDWLENYLRFNASVYLNDYKDLQIQTATLAGIFVTNAAEAKTQGLELELTYETPLGITLMGNYSYLKSEFEAGEHSGNDLGFAPESSYALGANYDWELTSGIINLFAMYSWQDSFYYDAANLLKEDDRGLIHAKITYTPYSDAWDLALGVENASDEEYGQFRQDIGLGQSLNRGMPRLWKVEFRKFF